MFKNILQNFIEVLYTDYLIKIILFNTKIKNIYLLYSTNMNIFQD